MFQSATTGPEWNKLFWCFLTNYPNSHDKAITSMARGSSLCFIKKHLQWVDHRRPRRRQSHTELGPVVQAVNYCKHFGEGWKTYFDIHIKHDCVYTLKLKRERGPSIFIVMLYWSLSLHFENSKRGFAPSSSPLTLWIRRCGCKRTNNDAVFHWLRPLHIHIQVYYWTKGMGFFFYLYSHARTVHPPVLQIVM